MAAGPTMWPIRGPSSERRSSSARIAISSSVVPPRLFSSATCGPSPRCGASLATQAVIAWRASFVERPAARRPRRGCRGRARPSRARCAPPSPRPAPCRCRGTSRSCGPPAMTRWAARATSSRLPPASATAPRDLVHQERSRDPTRLGEVGQGHVVLHHDHLDLEPEGARALGGQAEVQPVAGVVLDDEQASGLAGDGQDAGQHRLDRGRGEHVAADRRRQHPPAHEAGNGPARGPSRPRRPAPPWSGPNRRG